MAGSPRHCRSQVLPGLQRMTDRRSSDRKTLAAHCSRAACQGRGLFPGERSGTSQEGNRLRSTLDRAAALTLVLALQTRVWRAALPARDHAPLSLRSFLSGKKAALSCLCRQASLSRTFIVNGTHERAFMYLPFGCNRATLFLDASGATKAGQADQTPPLRHTQSSIPRSPRSD